MTLDEIVSRLKRIKQTSNGYTALCPAHNDEKNSLSLSDADGKILMNCFAGCSVNDICTALEIKVSDLFTSTSSKPKKKEIKRELVCAYDYQDQDSESLYQNVKEKITFDDGSTDKDFYARRFDKKGKEIRNLDGVLRVPYRLPELVKLPAKFAFITTEGEKDADKLKENGLIATNHKNWKPEFNYLLKGKNVVIFADHDKTGIELAKKTARTIFPDAKAVKIVDCFEGEPIPEKHGRDVSDWLELGHAKDELLKIIKDTPNFDFSEKEADAGKSEKEKANQATRILRFSESLELFHTSDQETFATIETGGHAENHRINSKAFRSWLSFQFFQDEGQMPSIQALQDAIGTLEGKALFEGLEKQVFIRLASFEDKIYLDSCSEAWQIIEISKSGWRIIEAKDAPVKFRRTKAMLSLPTPAASGDLSKIRQFLNVSDANYVLILAWLVNCFRPDYPFPVLILSGEQGSAKSTTSRLLRELVDPNKTAFRSAPRDERDLIIAANNAWICAFDNLSTVQHWLSDALCRISTGGGFSTRTLYENDEETIFTAKRPILINGIGDLASRSDLLDRALLVHLEQIPETRRQAESEFWRKYEKEKPAIFSGLLTAVSSALQKIDGVKLDRLPRMADFALWVTAAENGLGLKEKSFLEAYTVNRDNVNETALEGSPVADTVKKFCEKNFTFEGTLKDFLTELDTLANDETKKSKDYPKTPRALRSRLERINPNLRAIGIDIKFLAKSDKGRLLKLEYSRIQPSEPSEPSESPKNKAETTDGLDLDSQPTVSRPSEDYQPSANRQDNKLNKTNGLDNLTDGSDGSDGHLHPRSNGNGKAEFVDMEI